MAKNCVGTKILHTDTKAKQKMYFFLVLLCVVDQLTLKVEAFS